MVKGQDGCCSGRDPNMGGRYCGGTTLCCAASMLAGIGRTCKLLLLDGSLAASGLGAPIVRAPLLETEM